MGVSPSAGRAFSADDARSARRLRHRQPRVLDAASAVDGQPLGAASAHRRPRLHGRRRHARRIRVSRQRRPLGAGRTRRARIQSRTSHNFSAVGRLRPGVTPATPTPTSAPSRKDIVRRVHRAGQLPVDGRGGASAADVAHRPCRIDAVHPARRRVLPSARRVRQRRRTCSCRRPPLGGGSWPSATRSAPDAAGSCGSSSPSRPCSSARPAPAVSCWPRSAFARSSRLRLPICRGSTSVA